MKIGFVCCAAFVALCWAMTQMAGATETGLVVATIAPEEDPLANPGFEGDFSYRHDPYTDIWAGELSVADGWDLWYDNSQECPDYDPDCNPQSYNRRPEYKRETNLERVRSGESAQKFFTTYGTHTAGLYQKLDVDPDSWVQFSIWVMAWSSNKDITDHSFIPGPYAVSVGIDPTGGESWEAPEIQWSVPITRHDEWVYLEVAAHTVSGSISVWTRATQHDPVKHNDSYWDDAELVVLDEPPTPTPTPTATRTPAPTPQPTPDGYEPPTCASWHTAFEDGFEGSSLDGWDRDPADGSVSIQGGALRLANGTAVGEHFPVVWLLQPLPGTGDMRVSFRFAFTDATGYGTTIGIGSQVYAGERSLAGSPDPPGIEDILRVHHRDGEYSIELLGQTAWVGTPGDETWHTVDLELREATFILSLDGVEQARGTSLWRPQTLFAGNPVIVWDRSYWTEVSLDNVHVRRCDVPLVLPCVMNRHTVAEPPVRPDR